MGKLLKNEKVLGIFYLLLLISVWAVSIMVAYPDFRCAFSGSIPGWSSLLASRKVGDMD